MKAHVGIILSLASLGACATVIPPADAPIVSSTPGSELIGRQLRLETANGQASMLRFAENGVVNAEFGGRQIAGSWVATNNQLCFGWPGASRECWPYTGPLPMGQTVTLTSDRGNVVRVTLQ